MARSHAQSVSNNIVVSGFVKDAKYALGKALDQARALGVLTSEDRETLVRVTGELEVMITSLSPLAARLDVDGTAKPLTSIVGHATLGGDCVGPGTVTPDTYIGEDGGRISLVETVEPLDPMCLADKLAEGLELARQLTEQMEEDAL